METIRNRRFSIALIVLATAAIATSVAATVRSGEVSDRTEKSLSIEGLKKSPFEVKQYAKLADLVVIGTPVSESVHPFTDNPLIPESAKSDEMYATAGFYDVTIQVTEYLMGKGPDQLSVRRLAPPPDVVFDSEAPTPLLNQSYVLFLTSGTDLWTGGYLALGQESLGSISSNEVSFPDEKTTVDKVREDVKDAEKEKNKP